MKDKILLKLRKATTPFHYLCGIITVLSGVRISYCLTALCFISFLLIQIWTEKEWKTSQHDFWEYTYAIFVTVGVLLILHFIGFAVK